MEFEVETYKVLILEDDANDKELVELELTTTLKLNLIFEWVMEEEQFIQALNEFKPDIVLSDYNLPQFNGFDALKLALKHDIDLPFIIVTGTLTEELAAESIKRGAWEYVVKERLNRLPKAFENALKLKNERLNLRKVEAELRLIKDLESIQLKLLWDGIAHAPNAVIITKSNGEIQYVNSCFEKTTGYSSAEVIGKNPRILKSGLHDNAVYKNLWGTILSGNEWRGELINRKKNGELLWEEVFISPVSDNSGKIQYFVALKNDISERKKAEDQLQESRQLFQTLAHSSPVGIFRTDAEGYTTYVNPKWIELSGLSFEKALGNGWLSAVHPEERKIILGNWNNNKAPIAEYRFLKPDGSIVWVIGNAVPEYKDNRIAGFIGTITDITERKRFEEQLQDSKNKFQNLVEEINDVLFELDANLNITYISPVISKVTGFNSSVYIGKSLSEVIYQEDLASVLERANDLLINQNALTIDYRTRNIDGELIWLRSSSKQIISDNKIIGIRGIAINITKQKETEQELIMAKERAEASNKLKTAFMNNISHEIRTPLNGILGFAPMVLESGITEQKKLHFLEIIKSCGERLTQTINNYMDISLITSGNLDVHISTINPSLFIEEIYLKHKQLFENKEIILKSNIQFEVYLMSVNSDVDLLTKIFEHLLNNALKFTKTGSVSIGAIIEKTNLKLYVKDTGIGIPEEVQQIIFERFMQEEVSATRKHEGSGLGLSIVKGLTDLLGITIELDSEKDKGSIFYLTMPK